MENESLAKEKAQLEALLEQPRSQRLKGYAKLCGPGWLQSAITLGGGSLSGALYLGIIGGYHFMWLQPLAMIMGIVMLSAISYVTLSTEKRPFREINAHISPVLGWGWLIATLMANIVWCLPQFALGTAAVTQNLAPAMAEMGEGGFLGKVIICAILLAAAIVVIWFYDSGARGVKIFETILKIMVGIVVLSFFGVVLVLAFKGGLPWGQIFRGLIPDFGMLVKPAPVLEEAMAGAGGFTDFWRNEIVTGQRDKIITAFATAVGINMTFLLPYSMLRKNWGRPHRGLAVFDLSTGLFIPFMVATGCVVIASASQFHGKFDDVLLENGTVSPSMTGAYNKVVDKRLGVERDGFGALPEDVKEGLRLSLPAAEKKIAAMLANRDAFNLANALQPLTGSFFAQRIFGIGVLGMALSTIIILMLISGFTFCEMFNLPATGWPHRIGCLIAGIGVLGPFIWKGDAKLALAIPTSVLGGALLPIAYFTFFLMMNSKALLGDDMPTGGRRLRWNVAMLLAASVAAFASVWGLSGKRDPFPGLGVETRYVAFGIIAVFVVTAAVQYLQRLRRGKV